MHAQPESTDSRIVIAVGEGAVYRDGRTVVLTPRENDVLCAIALHRRPIATDVLLESVWPEEDPERSRVSLKVQVHRIRRKVGAQAVIGFSGGLWSIGRCVRVDIHEWRTVARRADSKLSLAERTELAAAYETLIGPPPGIFTRSALAGSVEAYRRSLLFDVAAALANDALERCDYQTMVSIARDIRTQDDSSALWRELSVRAEAALMGRLTDRAASVSF